jgi:hypothetical protein
MSLGGGLFGRRGSAVSSVQGLSTQQNPQQPLPSTSMTTTDTDSSEPRRRHGSAPLATAFGLRRGSTPGTTASTTASRRSLTAEMPPPRKMSEPGTVHKPMIGALPPKRKPLPKGSAFEKQTGQEDQVTGKLGKMDLSGGSTMVLYSWLFVLANARLLENVCAVTRIYDSPLQCPVTDAPSASASTT